MLSSLRRGNVVYTAVGERQARQSAIEDCCIVRTRKHTVLREVPDNLVLVSFGPIVVELLHSLVEKRKQLRSARSVTPIAHELTCNSEHR